MWQISQGNFPSWARRWILNPTKAEFRELGWVWMPCLFGRGVWVTEELVSEPWMKKTRGSPKCLVKESGCWARGKWEAKAGKLTRSKQSGQGGLGSSAEKIRRDSGVQGQEHSGRVALPGTWDLQPQMAKGSRKRDQLEELDTAGTVEESVPCLGQLSPNSPHVSSPSH